MARMKLCFSLAPRLFSCFGAVPAGEGLAVSPGGPGSLRQGRMTRLARGRRRVPSMAGWEGGGRAALSTGDRMGDPGLHSRGIRLVLPA